MLRGFRNGRRRWYSAIGATAAIGVIAGGLAIALPHHPRLTTRPLADSCGLVNCGAHLPTPSASDSSASKQARHAKGRHTSPSPRPSPSATSPSPRPSPSPTVPPPPGVIVRYALVSDRGHHTHFQGMITLTNNGSASVAGWTLRLAFPSDHISWVGPPRGRTPFRSWSVSGDLLVLKAESHSETLPAGGSEQIVVIAHGPTATPSSCDFDGATCAP